MLKYYYITNNPQVAKIAESAGVDRIFIDMEYIGKAKRQLNMDTVQNHHTVEDVITVRKAISTSELLVRINPWHSGSIQEIESVIEAGADIIMLPMWKTVDEVKAFIRCVDNRTKTLLLLETEEARLCIDKVVKINGVDEIHIGLNDLHLAQHKQNMFELLVDGTVDSIISQIKPSGIPYGIGGVGAVGSGLKIPAEYILSEHYRLGSSMAILARAFCNTDVIKDLNEVCTIFYRGISANREFEKFLSTQNDAYFDDIHSKLFQLLEG